MQMKAALKNKDMNILLLADEESKFLYDFYDPERLKDVDLIISCGDLRPEYLTFFVSLCNVPLLYVKGNHDKVYDDRPPEGCICIDGDIYVHNGVRIMGLGGCMEYIPRSRNQYTERYMTFRVLGMCFKILRHRGFDILVTHAPAYQINDLEHLPHRGFKIFRTLMEVFKPKYFFHGHVHSNYTRSFKRVDTFCDTTIVNGYEYYIVHYPPEKTDAK